MTPQNNIPLLTEAILAVHGCSAAHSWTAQVHESWEGQTVWQGEVEVFTLSGHPRTDTAYAWNFVADSGKTQSVAVLKVPPIETPSDAVRAAIASGRIQ